MNHLIEEFSDHICMTDVEKKSDEERQNILLSRALTALTLQDLTACSATEASHGVIDGRDDYGIDGIGVDLSGSRLFIVQAKWSKRGKAGFDKASALLLREGIQKLKNQDFEPFNERFQALAPLVGEALANPELKITVALALSGDGSLSDVVSKSLGETLAEFNELGEVAELDVYSFERFHGLVRRGLRDSPVSLVAPLQGWSMITDPFQAVYGRVAAADVAEWYRAHGEKLFAQNIRRSLGVTEVNRNLRRTLTEEPDNFWYFNNGITLLCESFKRAPAGNRDASHFHVSGASVVNGAQTVHAVADVVRSNGFPVEASVWIRLISLENCPPNFANSVTEATNRQNTVVARDFVSLDPAQAEIREDMALTLRKVYVVKRGEPDPAPESGCSVSEAARALAVSHPNPELAARANQGDDAVLFQQGGSLETYNLIFVPRPSADRVWLAVRLLRRVSDRVAKERERRYARAASIADLASPLVTHIVAAHLRSTGSDPLHEEVAEEALDESVTQILDRVIAKIDELYGPTSFPASTLRSAERCSDLSHAVLAEMIEGGPQPELPPSYFYRRPTRNRRANAVSVLVDAQRIADGEPMYFIALGEKGQALVETWIEADERRGQATWTNRRSGCLIWSADGANYSPSGLAKKILNEAGVTTVAVQGPIRWQTGSGQTIAALAEEIRSD